MIFGFRCGFFMFYSVRLNPYLHPRLICTLCMDQAENRELACIRSNIWPASALRSISSPLEILFRHPTLDARLGILPPTYHMTKISYSPARMIHIV